MEFLHGAGERPFVQREFDSPTATRQIVDRATGFATRGPHSIGVIVTQAVHPKPQGGFSLTNRSQSVEQATQTSPGVNDDSEEAAQETSSYFTLPSPPLPQQYAGRRR